MLSVNGGGKGKRRGLYGGSFFTSYLSLKALDVRKGIVAVIHNIGIIPQNFSAIFALFAGNVAAETGKKEREAKKNGVCQQLLHAPSLRILTFQRK